MDSRYTRSGAESDLCPQVRSSSVSLPGLTYLGFALCVLVCLCVCVCVCLSLECWMASTNQLRRQLFSSRRCVVYHTRFLCIHIISYYIPLWHKIQTAYRISGNFRSMGIFGWVENFRKFPLRKYMYSVRNFRTCCLFPKISLAKYFQCEC